MLLIGLIVMVFKDGTREWKGYQREFMEYSREMAEEELHKIEKEMNHKELEALESALIEAQTKIESSQAEIQVIKDEIAALDVQITIINGRYQELKQHQDSERYFFEEHRQHHDEEKAEHFRKRLDVRAPKITQAKLELEKLEKAKEEKQAKVNAIIGKEKELKLEITRLTSEKDRVERKIEKLTPDWRKDLLNAPMLDFIKPTLQIQQIVLEDLHDDYYFAKVNKVDRCITCHLGIDQQSFEDAPKPFKPHPRLDLFVAPNSPHPMEEFGCTTCHGGSGHSVSFTTAAHTPQNEKQAKEWKKEHHWKPMKHWADKMLPLNHVEASCAKCHSGVVDVPKAEKLNEGRKLARTFGCFGCHKVDGFEDAWKAGPSLKHVQSKLESDWIVRWLHNPREFRPSTKMPRVFHLSNTSDEDSKEKSNASIAGIAAYLMKNSDAVSLETPPVKGNPEVGKQLVKDLGCMGCHGVEGESVSIHGPELSGLGSKVSADWIYTWIKNPKHYSEETRMPDFRLTDQEASDITSYLMADKNDKFESARLPLVKQEVVDDIALHFFTGTMRHEEAKAKLQKMSPEEKLEFVGKKSIQHQGCFGCHDIKGFEDANRIGTELNGEGSKDIHKFDFGFIHDIEHTRKGWIFQKLKEPRIFDQGKDKPYFDKLRMPQFDFEDEQAERITTFILSLVNTEIPLSKQRTLSKSDKEIEKGRKLVAQFNCQGCHTLDGVEGGLREITEDIGNAPPIIDGTGEKVQPNWLYHFLEEPTTIRPWLKYRMPSFKFNEEQLNTLVQYFNHLDQMPQSFAHEEALKLDPEKVRAGEKLFTSFQCIKCHKSNPEPGLSASFLAPDLVISKDRLRPEWVKDWLWDPQEIQAGTMMPGFFPEGQSPVEDVYEGDAKKQIEAIRDYIWQFHGESEQTTNV